MSAPDKVGVVVMTTAFALAMFALLFVVSEIAYAIASWVVPQ